MNLQRPSAKELLKYTFIKKAKKNSFLVDLIEKFRRYKANGGGRSDSDSDTSDTYVISLLEIIHYISVSKSDDAKSNVNGNEFGDDWDDGVGGGGGGDTIKGGQKSRKTTKSSSSNNIFNNSDPAPDAPSPPAANVRHRQSSVPNRQESALSGQVPLQAKTNQNTMMSILNEVNSKSKIESITYSICLYSDEVQKPPFIHRRTT